MDEKYPQMYPHQALDGCEVCILIRRLNRFIVGTLSAFGDATGPDTGFVVSDHRQAVHRAAWSHCWLRYRMRGGRGVNEDQAPAGSGWSPWLNASDSSAASVFDLVGVLSEPASIPFAILAIVFLVVAHRQYRLIVLDRWKDRS